VTAAVRRMMLAWPTNRAAASRRGTHGERNRSHRRSPEATSRSSSARQAKEKSMNPDQPHARIGHRGSALSRAKHLASKALIVVGGGLVLASAAAISLVLVAIGLAFVLIFGGYFWWRTRDLRRQIRSRMESQSWSTGDIIEGEVVSQDRTRR
jgi:Flp pilus assembly protein TadB